MNVGSGAQVQQLLFAGVPNRDADKKDPLPLERVFKVDGQAFGDGGGVFAEGC